MPELRRRVSHDPAERWRHGDLPSLRRRGSPGQLPPRGRKRSLPQGTHGAARKAGSTADQPGSGSPPDDGRDSPAPGDHSSRCAADSLHSGSVLHAFPTDGGHRAHPGLAAASSAAAGDVSGPAATCAGAGASAILLPRSPGISPSAATSGFLRASSRRSASPRALTFCTGRAAAGSGGNARTCSSLPFSLSASSGSGSDSGVPAPSSSDHHGARAHPGPDARDDRPAAAADWFCASPRAACASPQSFPCARAARRSPRASTGTDACPFQPGYPTPPAQGGACTRLIWLSAGITRGQASPPGVTAR